MRSLLPTSRTATIALLGALLSGTGATAASAPAEQLVERQGRQPASASVLSEHHIEALDAMEPQAQAEFLLERAINHYQGANEQIAARAESWRGKITLNKKLNGLFVTALNSDDLRVRAASIELNLVALNLKKSSATVDRLEPDARSGAQGLRANALWRIGLLGNRGVEPDRALQILLDSILDENVNVRYWAVEGLAYLGTDGTIAPLLSVFRDDASPLIRERAACSLAQSGMLSAKQRMTTVPRLLDLADYGGLDDQTRSWVFQALRDITGQTMPRDAATWRKWYDASIRK
jgi:hypothetical protein